MKTVIVFVAIVIICKISITKGENKFDCPVECPPNVYQPVCSRGISYANLCILKQEICKGKTARDIYDDVESCPGYEKKDDASGKSVETVDENGVIFRSYIDTTKKNSIITTDPPEESLSTIRGEKNDKYINNDRNDESIEKISPPLCSCGGNNFPNNCPKQFICNSYWPLMPIFFVGNNVKLSNDMTFSNDDKEVTAVDNNFLRRLLGVLPGATRGSRSPSSDLYPDKEIPTKCTKKCQRCNRKRNKTKTSMSSSSVTSASLI